MEILVWFWIPIFILNICEIRMANLKSDVTIFHSDFQRKFLDLNFNPNYL